jgi:hypothetical protein
MTVMGNGTDRTILEVLADLEKMGFTGQFVPRDGAQVECVACHELHPADETVLRELERLEGASDPDDMVAVVGLECPHCGAKGTAVLSYGPEAPLLDAEVLQSFEDAREGA